jgi:hypothetical protein
MSLWGQDPTTKTGLVYGVVKLGVANLVCMENQAFFCLNYTPKNIKQGVVSNRGLVIYIIKYLKAKEETQIFHRAKI